MGKKKEVFPSDADASKLLEKVPASKLKQKPHGRRSYYRT